MKKTFLFILVLLAVGAEGFAQDIKGLYPGARYGYDEVVSVLKSPLSMKPSRTHEGETEWAFNGLSLDFRDSVLVGWTMTASRYKAFKNQKPGGLKVGNGINALNGVKNGYPKRVPGTHYWKLFDYQDVYDVTVEAVDSKITFISCRFNGIPDGSADKEKLSTAFDIPETKLY